MADLTTLRESPLAHLAGRLPAEASSVGLREVPFLAMTSLRVGPGGSAAERIARVLGCPLPDAAGETTAAGEHTVLWLGPDEWLVVSGAATDGSDDAGSDDAGSDGAGGDGPGSDDPGGLVQRLRQALAGEPGSVVDVSANRTTLELAGPRARDVLEKGCPTDLHPRAFGAGRAVTSAVGPVPVLLWQTGPATYRLLPRSSFADYLARWLLDAMTEYVAEEAPGRRAEEAS